MSTKSAWRWSSLLVTLLMIISTATMTVSAQPAPTYTAAASSAAPVQQPPPPEAKKAPEPVYPTSPSSAVSIEEALRKLHPDLRELAQAASPALPEQMGPLAPQAQEPIFVEVFLTVGPEEEKEEPLGLDKYFVDGKYIARPPFGKGEQKTQILIGRVMPSSLLKIASLGEVKAIIPIYFERTMEPEPYPADEPRQIPERGPEDWAKLYAESRALSQSAPDWDEAKAFGDGRPDIRPLDWFEVMPEGPHKAQTAWNRGYTGEGVTVAVLDDGIDPAHPDLLGTQKIYSSTVAPQYNGWPYVFSPFSMLLYVFDSFYGTSYIADGFPSIHYVDTSTTPDLYPCGTGISCFEYTPLIDYGVLNPNGPYTYIISNTMTKSGVVHVGTHPDNDLRDWVWGEKVAVLVTDPNVAGVYDTVYIDLDDDHDFTDEKPLTKADPTDPSTYNDMIAYRDLDGDGLADISGGMVYFIADGSTCIPVSDWMWGCPSVFAPIPSNGDLIAISGSTFDRAYSHGTQCASNIVGQGRTSGMLPSFRDLPGSGKPAGAVFGMAPDAKVVNISDIYYNFDSSVIDAYIFAAVGYDGLDQTDPGDSDAIQITTNSYGASDVDNDGWEYEGQVVSQIQRWYAPYLQFLFSTGNGAPAYGTVAPPSPATGIGVGASTEFGSTGWDSITDTTQIMYNDVTPFSNRGPGARGTNGVDVVAGGAFAAGAEELNYYVPYMWGSPSDPPPRMHDGNLSWDSWGGTSRSAPVAGGVLALIYQAYKERFGHWPTYDVAKALLKSTATDLNYDTFTQGAGSVNADRGTAVAAGLYGLFATPDEWNPGDYRGDDYPGFAHIAYPGDTFTETFAVVNLGPEPVTATVADYELNLIDTYEFTFTVTPDMVAAESAYGSENQDNFFKAFNYFIPITATPGMSSTWYNIPIPSDTDLMIVRQMFPYDQFDPNGDYSWDNRFYLVVYNWQDVDGDGVVWEDKDGNGVVNFINDPTTYGDQADGAIELDWDDPRTEIDRWEFGRFSYHRPGGNRNEMWVHDPLDRMIDGLFIGLRHHPGSTYTGTTTLRYRIEFYKKQDVPWLDVSASSLTIPAGVTATLVATATVPLTMPAGEYEAGIYIEDPGWMSYTADTTVIPVVLSVASVFTEGMQFGGYDAYNSPYNAGHPYNNAAVRGLSDWTWRAESGDWRFFFSDLRNCSSATVFQEGFEGATFPPSGWQVYALSGVNWEQTNARVYEGSYSAYHDDTTGDQDAWLVMPQFTPTANTILTFWQNENYASWYTYHGIWVSTGSGDPNDGDFVELVELGAGTEDTWEQVSVDLSTYAGQPIYVAFRYQGNWSDEWYIDDVRLLDTVCTYPAGSKFLVRDQWDDVAPHTDIDTIVLGPTPSSLGSGWYDFSEPDFYGPYVLDTVGRSPNTYMGSGIWRFNTSSGANEDWITAPFPDWRPNRDGLHEFLQHNVLFEGLTFDVVFTKTIGTLWEDVHSFTIDTYLDSGKVGSVTIKPGLDLNGLAVDGYLIDPLTQTWTDEPLAFVAPYYEEWTYVFTVTNAAYIEAWTSSADISDIDLYLYRWDGAAWQLMDSSTTASASEYVYVDDPADGQWMIGVDNWSGPAGHFNLTLNVGTKVGGLSFTGVPTGTLSAGVPVSFTVNFNYPMEPGRTYEGVVLVGPPEAPSLKEIPVTINRLPESAMIEKSVNWTTAFPGNELEYTIELYNLSDPGAHFVFTDPIPANTEFVTVTGDVITPTYDAGNNQVVYTGTLPLGTVKTPDQVKNEGFEEGAVPPLGWEEQTTTANNWSISTVYVHSGSYGAYVPWGYSQDEWLIAPEPISVTGGMTFTFWSMGSVYWCRDTLDNCDLNVWLLVDDVGGGDDVLLGKAEDFWPDNWVWTPCTFTLPITLPSGTLRIGFEYVGDDGADVGLDDIVLPGTYAPIYLPSALVTVTVRITDTVAPDSWITNTGTVVASHSLPQETQVEAPVSDSATTHIGAEDFATSYKDAPAEVDGGDTLTYEIHVINSGDKLAYVTFTDTVPAGTTYSDHWASPYSAYYTYDAAEDQVEWYGHIAPGEEMVFYLEVVVDSDVSLWGTELVNTAYISWDGNVMPLQARTTVLPPYNVYLPQMFRDYTP